MREYAAKKQPNAVQHVPPEEAPISGMSNQAMLAFLSASQKQRVSEEDEIRQKLTERFGVDFSGLKITKDAALEDVQERAYTKGNEIHLAPDVNPGSPEGQEILMHEAVHVIQQGTRSLSSGMLHDSAMEAQANDIAMGAGHIDVSGFSMPTADGAPVQGFLDFIFNRKKYNANRAKKLLQQAENSDPELNREMGKRLAKYGLSGGTAIFDPQKHANLFGQATESEDVFSKRPLLKKGVTASELKRELVGLPKEELTPNSGIFKLYGVSQEELDAMSSLNPEAYRSLIDRTYRGTVMAANMDWTRMSDSEFIKNYTLLRGISRLAVVANQAPYKVGIDKELVQKDPNVEVMIKDPYNNIGNLMTYADLRLRSIVEKGERGGESESTKQDLNFFTNVVLESQRQINENYAAITPAAPKKRGFFSRLFEFFKRGRRQG